MIVGAGCAEGEGALGALLPALAGMGVWELLLPDAFRSCTSPSTALVRSKLTWKTPADPIGASVSPLARKLATYTDAPISPLAKLSPPPPTSSAGEGYLFLSRSPLDTDAVPTNRSAETQNPNGEYRAVRPAKALTSLVACCVSWSFHFAMGMPMLTVGRNARA